MIISNTTALCNRCYSSHSAELTRTEDRIVAIVHCPEGDIQHEISTDADLFLEIRNRSATRFDTQSPPQGLRYVLNYLSITNACNLNCTVCGAAARQDSEKAVFLSLDEICTRATEARRQGARLLHLFGGEPTLHPQLLEIVERLAGMGFSLGMVTNGLRLGTDDTLAKKLKAAGLARICLQFDSLDPAILEMLGRNYLEEKLLAIRSAIAAGLTVGLNCTVTRHNLPEVGQLLIHGIEHGVPVRNMTFASAAPVGRYKLAENDSVDREQIVRQLLAAGDRYGFSAKDLLPLPAYLPWGIQTHPDCGAHIIFVRTPRGVMPLNRLIDLQAVYRSLGSNRMRPHFFTTHLLPALTVIRHIRNGRRLASLRVATGLLFAKSRYGLLNIGISNYKGASFLDEQRLALCSSAFHTSIGPVKGCLHFCGDPKTPGTKTYEECHQSC